MWIDRQIDIDVDIDIFLFGLTHQLATLGPDDLLDRSLGVCLLVANHLRKDTQHRAAGLDV